MYKIKKIINEVPLEEVLSVTLVVIDFIPIPGLSIVKKILKILISVKYSMNQHNK